MKFIDLVHNKGFKGFLFKLYSLGASIVVLGALFKLQHWPGAGFMLSTGLITEAVIFFFYAWDSEDEPVQVYPEILDPVDEGDESIKSYNGEKFPSGNGSLALAKFDQMLSEAEITPDLLYKFGEGIRKLSETTEGMNSLGNISAASSQYLKTLKSADESLRKHTQSYEDIISKTAVKALMKHGNIADSLSVIEEETKSYRKQMECLNENISLLNSIYKFQKENIDGFMKDLARSKAESQKYREEIRKDLSESAAESQRYREEIKKLNENLSKLNNVYCNMLSAMNNNK